MYLPRKGCLQPDTSMSSSLSNISLTGRPVSLAAAATTADSGTDLARGAHLLMSPALLATKPSAHPLHLHNHLVGPNTEDRGNSELGKG